MGLFGPKTSLTLKKNEIAEISGLIQQVLEQWLGFKRFFLKGFSAETIVTEDEAAFLDLKNQLTRSMRGLSGRFDEKMFYFGGDKANSLMRQSVSISHLRSLPVQDRRQVYKEWHTVFVHLSRAVGAFKFLSEGYLPPVRQTKAGASGPGGNSLASIKAAGKGVGNKSH